MYLLKGNTIEIKEFSLRTRTATYLGANGQGSITYCLFREQRRYEILRTILVFKLNIIPLPPSCPALYCPIWISIFRYLTVDGYITAITPNKTFLSSPYWDFSGTFSEYSSSNWQGQWGLALSIPAFFLQTLLLNSKNT